MKRNLTYDGADVRELRTITALLTGALIVALTVLLSFSKTHGQMSGQSLEVSPPSQELIADPGETVIVKAKVRNRAETPLPITVRIEDFVATGEGGQVSLTEKGPWAVSTWTTVAPVGFTLKPGEVREVEATVAVPRSGVAGGRYGSFVFSVSGEGGPGKAALSQEVASLFLLRVSGPVEEKISIQSFSIPAFLEFGPVPMTLSFTNTGNVHLKPQGVVTISNMLGGKVADVPIDGVNVFPQAKRTVTTNWNTTYLIGRYSAKALVYTGSSSNELMEATATFFVFPWRIVIVAALVIAALFILRRRIRKALKALMGK
ncbi:hypothetical protein A2Z33_00195 [Candidatus Gottesmanbacteria bacterium RBG_16_52_11]|uniref:Uncharacterized protein n=1 Tax=Candidatus Gottesmanbacteria bacterium RBG_16_52_11 TaxID=1798374 RepID=A0A1F5YNP5_9BACT|nr:MAG: hypothetical protein A2Z33_00195 [Candidatus Gottesmanbacteria bacterium RBG_16_52_11]